MEVCPQSQLIVGSCSRASLVIDHVIGLDVRGITLAVVFNIFVALLFVLWDSLLDLLLQLQEMSATQAH